MDEVIIIINNIVWKDPVKELPSKIDQIPRWINPNRQVIKNYLEGQYNHQIENFEYEVWSDD